MAADFAAGTVAGIAGVVVGHPADTVKVRLQSSLVDAAGRPLYRDTWHCAVTIVKSESVLGLYKGLSSPIVGVGVINAVLFGVYGALLRLQHDGADQHSAPLKQVFLAGVGTGFVNSFVSCPFELAKINMQNQGIQPGRATSFLGPVDVLMQLYRANGLAGCYRGMVATVWRETPSYGVYFATYEGLCRWLTPPGTDVRELRWPRLLVAGGIGGMAAWASTYPLDVIKTKLQDASTVRPDGPYRSTWDCAVRSYRAEGPWVFTRGLAATLLRAFPTNAATLLVYTMMMRALSPASSTRNGPEARTVVISGLE